MLYLRITRPCTFVAWLKPSVLRDQLDTEQHTRALASESDKYSQGWQFLFGFGVVSWVGVGPSLSWTWVGPSILGWVGVGQVRPKKCKSGPDPKRTYTHTQTAETHTKKKCDFNASCVFCNSLSFSFFNSLKSFKIFKSEFSKTPGGVFSSWKRWTHRKSTRKDSMRKW